MAIVPQYIGNVGETGVYRVSLASLGVSRIGEIAILDDGVISGGTGGKSGFDLDFVGISSTLTDDAATAASLTGTDLLKFDATETVFRAGFQQTWLPSEKAEWNSPTLFGTAAGSGNAQVDFTKVALGLRDGTMHTDVGALSLGEGGGVSFLLSKSVDPAGLYLYFGDAGRGNDGVRVAASETRDHDGLPDGLTLKGTADNDDLTLGTGANLNLGTGDDVVNGGAGDDTIATGAADDRIAGGSGNDTIDGGSGTDVAAYQGTRDEYTVSTNPDGSTTVTDTVQGRDGTDVVSNVETIRFARPDIDRLFDPVEGGHFYTTSAAERDAVNAPWPGPYYEGIAFYGADPAEAGAVPVYAFYAEATGGHFLTASAAERDAVEAAGLGMRFEGTSFFAATAPQEGYAPVYRFYNATAGAHFFTENPDERDQVLTTLPSMKYEGVAFYMPTSKADVIFDL